MTTDPHGDPHETAIAQLRHLGLSTYAARTFVALTALGTATAKDVSEVSDVPRTRVYDAVDELHELGLVDIQQAHPKQFWAVSAESAGRTFRNDLQHRADQLTAALSAINDTDGRGEQRGVWTANGRATVTDRVVEFIDDAESEIVYMTVEELLDDQVLDAIESAADRGVSIELAGSPQAVEERILQVAPEASVFDSRWLWSDTPAGRLLMADGTRTLASVVTPEGDDSLGGRTETAIWGVGDSNSLVTVLKALFTWRLDGGTADTRPDDDANSGSDV
ncbi:TrmB family transcriptional regulator [Halobaculum marinum]|uniref:TrmB family transcriptional regulator n=1 Tax=Halobaculum marinum TaxID=3031996 RepID=A0ABD5WXY7_9EURY|nr:helix-turn-helix domain-containing protein [Halobaculum sp. DT55]